MLRYRTPFFIHSLFFTFSNTSKISWKPYCSQMVSTHRGHTLIDMFVVSLNKLFNQQFPMMRCIEAHVAPLLWFYCIEYLMAQCKTAVTPACQQWSYCSLALSHWSVMFYWNIMKWDFKIDTYLAENSMDIIYNFKYQGELLLSTKKIITFAASDVLCVTIVEYTILEYCHFMSVW